MGRRTHQSRLLMKNYRLSDDIAFPLWQPIMVGVAIDGRPVPHWLSGDHYLLT